MVAGSPNLFAGSYALHRLQLPRHPPCTLSHLTIQPQEVSSKRRVLLKYNKDQIKFGFRQEVSKALVTNV